MILQMKKQAYIKKKKDCAHLTWDTLITLTFVIAVTALFNIVQQYDVPAIRIEHFTFVIWKNKHRISLEYFIGEFIKAMPFNSFTMKSAVKSADHRKHKQIQDLWIWIIGVFYVQFGNFNLCYFQGYSPFSVRLIGSAMFGATFNLVTRVELPYFCNTKRWYLDW